jgi:hypothetical protein
MEEDWLKLEIKNGRQGAFFGSFFTLKMTHLPIHHHGDCRMSLIVSIVSMLLSITIGNSKWPPGGCLSMKTMHICICSRFYKYGRILSKFGMQDSI